MLGTQDEAQQSLCDAQLARMLPTLVHALRTPLSGLAMGIEVAALRLCQHDDDAGFLQPMRQTLGEMTDSLDQLTRFARPAKPRIVAVHPQSFVRETLAAWRRSHPSIQVKMHGLQPMAAERRLGRKLCAFTLDADAVHQSIYHLLDNAREAGAPAPIDVQWVQPTPKTLTLRVRNAGPKLPKDVLARMAEPFFTTKHRHMGLGLAFAERIATAHRGTLGIESDAKHTSVTLQLRSLEDELQTDATAMTPQAANPH